MAVTDGLRLMLALIRSFILTNNNNNHNNNKRQWREKRIGFHLTEVNPTIVKYAERFLLPSSSRDGPSETCSNARVLVPLCGKTVDMAYLATATSASEVVGVEGIRLALEEFAEEHPALRVVVEAAGTAAMTADDAGGAFERFEGERITLLRGDYFELNAQEAGGKFGLIYDRASLVAIEPGLRTAYVDVQGELLEPGGRILLVVLERRGPEEAMKEGPPYSVPESAVRALYEGKDWVQSVEWLEQSDQLETKPEDKARYPDLDQLLETVYLIETKT